MTRQITWHDRLISLQLFAWLIPGTARAAGKAVRAARRSDEFPPGDLRRYVDDVQRRWSQALLERSETTVRLETQTPLAPGQQYVVVANHQSYFDVPSLVSALPLSLRFVAKVELSRVPFFGPGMAAAGHVVIDRSRGEEAYRRMREQLQASETSISIFPEGTRTKNGELGPFKRGAFALAVESGLPILPVAIRGSYPIHPMGSFWIKSGCTIDLRVAPPVSPAGMSPEALRDDVRERMVQLLGQAFP